ncbi:MAG TPA: type II toxin-antitoxin system Phd/YefM family antitoxin [Fibrobacteraceae bacterium]|jgi:antitoxin (DNA-binding transcriptional repressor) of toxin-antitoxin stability system|nr:type II toxin-antitoxin system Phd/YefM family antitoxin [Fibrobacter sp.]HOG68311.1 type II toxin-antitoxin system Phd/YefM family antitoxin [Fibrobacteraceae bacterium]HPW94612.1 type II toxin-antitoxin system Phd/YefM family antitoxin [Fibrobacteraceae bacterium]
MAKIVSAMEVRQNFGSLLNQVSLLGEEIVIERSGKSIARLVSISEPSLSKLDFRDIAKLPSIK